MDKFQWYRRVDFNDSSDYTVKFSAENDVIKGEVTLESITTLN